VQSLSTAKEFNAAHSYVYKHEGAATPEGIIKLIEEIRDGKADEYFKSQNPPKARKYSLKLCGKTFKKEILDDQDTCVHLHPLCRSFSTTRNIAMHANSTASIMRTWRSMP
jgi:hypothetical protein